MGTTGTLARRTAAAIVLAVGIIVLAAGPASAVMADRNEDGNVDVVVFDTDADGAIDGP